MPKFYGPIGYAQTVEAKPGVWKEQIVERNASGDLIRNTRQLQSTSQVNDNIKISNEFSIIADPFVNENFFSMRYIVFMGAKWKITNVDASQPPRLILTTGGLYNGK